MGKYTKKPVTIEAVQFDGKNFDEIAAFAGDSYSTENVRTGPQALYILTAEGPLHASPGDWIIKGVKGEFYPCKPDIFAATYDAAE